MNRVPTYDATNFSDAEKQIWKRICDTRGGVWGPYAVLMRTPELASRVAAIGEHIRFQGLLGSDLRETAILATAIENQCQFEWFIHEPIARQCGVSSQVLAVLEQRSPTADLPVLERNTIEFVRAVCSKKRVEEELFRTVEAALGQEPLVELVTLIGFYSLLAVVINTYEVAPE